jgi:DivIVA domain-containing protein
VLVVEVVLGVFAVAVVTLGLTLLRGRLTPAPPDSVEPYLPADRLLTSADIPQLRFRIALRGYRFADVDAALEAVHAALWAAERGGVETEGEGAGQDAGVEA